MEIIHGLDFKLENSSISLGKFDGLHKGHRLFLCFLFGIVAGTFLMNGLLADFAGKIGIYSKYFFNGVNVYDVNVDKMDFFMFCIKK